LPWLSRRSPGDERVKGKPASLRDIQDALSIGRGKAQQAQAHLRTLQAAGVT
jgi:hypothetical protein